MCYDAKSGPCSLIILQEAKSELLEHLKTPGEEGILRAEAKPACRGGGVDWEKRPTFEYIGVMGDENHDATLLVAGRVSLVRSLRVLLFQVRLDGHYKAKNNKQKGKGQREPKTKQNGTL